MLKKLKQKRYSKKIKTSELADYLGISKPFYCQIENGKRRLNYAMAVKIAHFFNVKPDNLFYEDMCEIIKKEDEK